MASADAKGQIQHVDEKDLNASGFALQTGRTLEPPELIRNMTKEQRRIVETRLKRKIDLRLMPPIIVMYILNYLDRVSISHLKFSIPKLISA